jgi:adenosylcobinamide-GDP ribazoletransferase
MSIIKGFFMAWGNFCIVPCPYRIWDEACRKQMLTMLPVLGLLMGVLWYGVAKVLLWLCIPQMLLAAVLTVYPFFISGFMHLDGYMDCCDAIFSRAPLEKKKQILKDSRVGAFAVIWLAVLFLVFFAAMCSIASSGSDHMEFLIITPVISRAAGSCCILAGKRLDVSQYENLERDSAKQIIFIVIFTVLISAVCIAVTDISVLAPAVLCAAAGILACFRAARSLGGVNGDIAGYGIVWAECFAVIGAAVVF